MGQFIYYYEQMAQGLFAPPIFCKHDQHLTSPHFLHLYNEPVPPCAGHLPEPLLVIVVGIYTLLFLYLIYLLSLQLYIFSSFIDHLAYFYL